MGDNEQQVSDNARAARAAGRQPVYVELNGSTKTYTFPVYAQMLRTNNAIIVRAYSHAYIFPANSVHASYGETHTPIELAQLPLVKARRVDSAIARGAQPGHYTQGDVAAKTRLCPDCVAFYGNPAFMRSFAGRWNGIKDAWQKSPDYTPWGAPPSKTGRSASNTIFTNCTRTYQYQIPGVQLLSDPLLSSNCTTSSFPSGGGFSGGSAGGGGSNGGGGSDPSCFMSSSDPTCGVQVAKYATCAGAYEKGTSVNGSTAHDDQISRVMAVFAQTTGGTSTIIGYEYQTYGGKEYIQFNVQLSVGASAGVVSMGLSGNLPVFPFPYNVLSANTKVTRDDCKPPSTGGKA